MVGSVVGGFVARPLGPAGAASRDEAYVLLLCVLATLAGLALTFEAAPLLLGLLTGAVFINVTTVRSVTFETVLEGLEQPLVIFTGLLTGLLLPTSHVELIAIPLAVALAGGRFDALVVAPHLDGFRQSPRAAISWSRSCWGGHPWRSSGRITSPTNRPLGDGDGLGALDDPQPIASGWLEVALKLLLSFIRALRLKLEFKFTLALRLKRC